MTRKPDGAEPRTTTVHVRFTPKGTTLLDAARGTATRSQYIRSLVAADIKARRVRAPKEG